jgi:hypothetical protein
MRSLGVFFGEDAEFGSVGRDLAICFGLRLSLCDNDASAVVEKRT